MGRAYEKGIRAAQAVVASVGQRPERTEPRTRQEVESFVKGYAAEVARAREAGWESPADSVWYDAGCRERPRRARARGLLAGRRSGRLEVGSTPRGHAPQAYTGTGAPAARVRRPRPRAQIEPG